MDGTSQATPIVAGALAILVADAVRLGEFVDAGVIADDSSATMSHRSTPRRTSSVPDGLIWVTSGSLKFMTGGCARRRIKVTLAATDDLTGVAYKARGDLVRGSLQRSIQEISSVVPNLVVDWATV